MTARSKCEAWLDGAVGLERWPDEGWIKPPRSGLLNGLLGFDQNGNPVYTAPPGTPPFGGVVITQGVMAPSGQAHIFTSKNHDDYGDQLRSRIARDMHAWAVFGVTRPDTRITWTAT